MYPATPCNVAHRLMLARLTAGYLPGPLAFADTLCQRGQRSAA